MFVIISPMFDLVIYSSLVISVVWYIYWYVKRRSLKGLNAPIHWPIFGPILDFKDLMNMDVLMSYMRNFKENFVFIILHFRIIGISDNKLIEFITNSPNILTKSVVYNVYVNWLGTGILLSNGSKWQKRRKIITPSFHYKLLEDYIDIFNSNADILVKQLSKETQEQCTDICPYITLHTLDVICESAMGTKIHAQTNESSSYVKSVKEICRIYIKRALSLEAFLAFFFKRTSKKEDECLKILHGFTGSVIKNRRLLLNKRKGDENDEFEKPKKNKRVFLDLLLESKIDGKLLTDEDIREEVDTFVFAGHDTTSTALSFTLFCLATNPEVQIKVLEEQTTMYGKNQTQDCTTTDLHNMKYLEMVIKETMRLYPPVPFIGREAIGDAKYSDDIIFKKNDQLCLFIYGLHRNPKFYPEPEAFIPERFSPENREGKPPLPYIPFSTGPRNCIGQKFAMLELKATLSKIIRMYELLPVVPAHKPILISETILKSDNGLLIRLKNRT